MGHFLCIHYRLQFNSHSGFNDAKEIIPYLHTLGISDIYCCLGCAESGKYRC